MDPPAEAGGDRRIERAVALMRRVLAVVAALARGLTRLAIWAGAAVATAWLLWLSEAPPGDGGTLIGRIVVLALLLLPSAILLLFVAGLRRVLEIPDRARELPAELRGRTAELRERSRGTTPRGVLGAAASLVQLGRLVLGSQDVLTPYATIAVALRPAILLAALLAAVVAMIEIPAALLALLVLLLA